MSSILMPEASGVSKSLWSSKSFNLWGKFGTSRDLLQPHAGHVFAQGRSRYVLRQEVSDVFGSQNLHKAEVFAA